MDPGGMLLQDFGQRADLTRRIREVLANCPEGTTALRELIQNADDARASRVCLCLDRRAHGARSLLAPALAQWQGPALLAHYAAAFTDDAARCWPWRSCSGISRIGSSKKASHAWKTGCFGEFRLIHELCLYVLSATQSSELILATLATLHAFLSWIPVGFIFESPLLETLLKFFPMAAYPNLTLQCLTEVAALQFGDFYNMQYVKMYTFFMLQLQAILPPGTIPNAYANGSNEEQAFIQNLALFFTAFFKVKSITLWMYPINWYS